MNTLLASRSKQTGAYLLEALIGILIFSLGILGIVGLQAASLRATSDAGLRAEAVFAANQVMGEMWADNENTLEAKYSSTLNGLGYQNFAKELKAAQAGAWIQDPTVNFIDAKAPTVTSKYVEIQIWWKVCQDANDPACSSVLKDGVHSYTTAVVIGPNQ